MKLKLYILNRALLKNKLIYPLLLITGNNRFCLYPFLNRALLKNKLIYPLLLITGNNRFCTHFFLGFLLMLLFGFFVCLLSSLELLSQWSHFSLIWDLNIIHSFLLSITGIFPVTWLRDNYSFFPQRSPWGEGQVSCSRRAWTKSNHPCWNRSKILISTL